MAHQNNQFIKILYAKINQGKNKTFMHNERFMHTILSKNPTTSILLILFSDASKSIGYGCVINNKQWFYGVWPNTW